MPALLRPSRQNEDIVEWLLDAEPGAFLCPVDLPQAPCVPPLSARLAGCAVRVGAPRHARTHSLLPQFDPVTSNTSGLFVARVGRRSGPQ